MTRWFYKADDLFRCMVRDREYAKRVFCNPNQSEHCRRVLGIVSACDNRLYLGRFLRRYSFLLGDSWYISLIRL